MLAMHNGRDVKFIVGEMSDKKSHARRPSRLEKTRVGRL